MNLFCTSKHILVREGERITSGDQIVDGAPDQYTKANDKSNWCNIYFFLSLEGTYKAMGFKKRNDKTPQFTDHCFTGDYPTQGCW